MNGDCEYVLDGHDTDGTPWYRCTTHDELAFGSIGGSVDDMEHVYCSGYIEIPYEERQRRSENPNVTGAFGHYGKGRNEVRD